MCDYKTNRELAEFMLSKISDMGYKPYDLEWSEDSSRVHFRLKGLGILGKHWLFGMWVNENWQYKEKRNEYVKKYGVETIWNVIQIFCQYDTQIDKFKPSCSVFCVRYTIEDLKKIKDDELIVNPWWKLESMIITVHKHPFLSYTMDSYGWRKEYYPEGFFGYFIKSESKETWIQIKKFFASIVYIPYTKIKLWLARRDSVIKEVTFKESDFCGAEYIVEVIFNQAATDEQMVRWLNKWFKRDRYGEYDTYDCVVELVNYFHQEGHKKGFTFW